MRNLIDAYSQKLQNDKILELEQKIGILEKTLPNKKNKITIGVQLLILHYLDVFNKIDAPSNTYKAKILKYIFSSEGEENIRKNLSHMNPDSNTQFKEPYTENNLKQVILIFTESNLEGARKKAENDLEKKLSHKK